MTPEDVLQIGANNGQANKNSLLRTFFHFFVKIFFVFHNF